MNNAQECTPEGLYSSVLRRCSGIQLTKTCSSGMVLPFNGDSAGSSRLFLRTVIATEHLINEPLRADILHVHFETGSAHKRNVQLRALLGVEATLDAVVNERHEPSRNDDAVYCISTPTAVYSLVPLTLRCLCRTPGCGRP
jgi:hypothetical protein